MMQRIAILTFATLMFNVSGAAMWLHQVMEHGQGHISHVTHDHAGAAWATSHCAGHAHHCAASPASPEEGSHPLPPVNESDCDTCDSLLLHLAGITVNEPELLGLLPVSVMNETDPTQVDQQPLFSHIALRAPPRGNTLHV